MFLQNLFRSVGAHIFAAESRRSAEHCCLANFTVSPLSQRASKLLAIQPPNSRVYSLNRWRNGILADYTIVWVHHSASAASPSDSLSSGEFQSLQLSRKARTLAQQFAFCGGEFRVDPKCAFGVVLACSRELFNCLRTVVLDRARLVYSPSPGALTFAVIDSPSPDQPQFSTTVASRVAAILSADETLPTLDLFHTEMAQGSHFEVA
jgi:hypothetical protein